MQNAKIYAQITDNKKNCHVHFAKTQNIFATLTQQKSSVNTLWFDHRPNI